MSSDNTPTPDTTSEPTPETTPDSTPGTAGSRSIELEVEVDGTPEEVWRAIATGPGISSWYVPHQVEEWPGGAAMASFGPGPEMQIPGRVAAWEPPHRIVFDGGEDEGGMAFEWTVEARDGGRCVVRLVNSGFGEGAEWDGQYDGMSEGWLLFLLNLKLHLQHFGGRSATSMLPTAMWTGHRDSIWQRLADGLGMPVEPRPGERLTLEAEGGLRLAGTVADAGPRRVAVLVDDPAPGTAIVAVEGGDDGAAVSVWVYLYGDDSAEIAAREFARWQGWLDASG